MDISKIIKNGSDKMSINDTERIGSVNWKFEGKWHWGIITEIEGETSQGFYFRYQTETMDGLYNPIMKANKNKDRIYFLTEESSNGDIDFPEFETKGIKAEIIVY